MSSDDDSYSYCTGEDVKRLTGVKPEHYNLENDDKEKLDSLLKDYIQTASSLINDYTENTFEDPVHDTIKLACSLIVSNIIAYASVRRDVPIRKKDDWNQDIVKVGLLTKEIKSLLDPFKSEETTHSKVDFFAITGD